MARSVIDTVREHVRIEFAVVGGAAVGILWFVGFITFYHLAGVAVLAAVAYAAMKSDTTTGSDPHVDQLREYVEDSETYRYWFDRMRYGHNFHVDKKQHTIDGTDTMVVGVSGVKEDGGETLNWQRYVWRTDMQTVWKHDASLSGDKSRLRRKPLDDIKRLSRNEDTSGHTDDRGRAQQEFNIHADGGSGGNGE